MDGLFASELFHCLVTVVSRDDDVFWLACTERLPFNDDQWKFGCVESIRHHPKPAGSGEVSKRETEMTKERGGVLELLDVIIIDRPNRVVVTFQDFERHF